MGKIVVTEFLSLDGVFEDPGGAEGFKYGGWSLKFGDTESQKYKYYELFGADALLLGRKTYEGFAKAWPTAKGTGDFGIRMNSIPKYVVSTTLHDLTWKNSHLISSDVAGEIAKLRKRTKRNVLVAGSGTLVHWLMQNNLVDRYCLMIHPVVLGSGRRLFAGTNNTGLKLVGTQSFEGGAAVLEYESA